MSGVLPSIDVGRDAAFAGPSIDVGRDPAFAGPSIDLREAVRKAPLVLPDADALAPEERRLALEHWRVHMAAEFASARVFAGLVPQLMAASLDFDTVRDVTDMARQEIEHGLLSARVYAALGGEPRSYLPPLDPVPQHEGCSPLEVVLRNVIAVSCCGETLAVSVIGAERERAKMPVLVDVLTSILRDEVGHARLGWRLLKDAESAMDDTMKKRLSAYLVAVFERDMRQVSGSRTGAEASFAALAVGAPDGPLTWTTYLDTVRQVTVPGLERHGIQAGWAFDRAWSRAMGDLPMPAPNAMVTPAA